MRVKSFITSITTLILSVVGSIILNSFNKSILPLSGVQLALSKTTLLVFYILVLVVTVPSVITGLISSIRSCFSESKAVKIISIILLVLNIGVCAFCTYAISVAYSIYF